MCEQSNVSWLINIVSTFVDPLSISAGVIVACPNASNAIVISWQFAIGALVICGPTYSILIITPGLDIETPLLDEGPEVPPALSVTA